MSSSHVDLQGLDPRFASAYQIAVEAIEQSIRPIALKITAPVEEALYCLRQAIWTIPPREGMRGILPLGGGYTVNLATGITNRIQFLDRPSLEGVVLEGVVPEEGMIAQEEGMIAQEEGRIGPEEGITPDREAPEEGATPELPTPMLPAPHSPAPPIALPAVRHVRFVLPPEEQPMPPARPIRNAPPQIEARPNSLPVVSVLLFGQALTDMLPPTTPAQRPTHYLSLKEIFNGTYLMGPPRDIKMLEGTQLSYAQALNLFDFFGLKLEEIRAETKGLFGRILVNIDQNTDEKDVIKLFSFCVKKTIMDKLLIMMREPRSSPVRARASNLITFLREPAIKEPEERLVETSVPARYAAMRDIIDSSNGLDPEQSIELRNGTQFSCFDAVELFDFFGLELKEIFEESCEAMPRETHDREINAFLHSIIFKQILMKRLQAMVQHKSATIRARASVLHRFLQRTPISKY